MAKHILNILIIIALAIPLKVFSQPISSNLPSETADTSRTTTQVSVPQEQTTTKKDKKKNKEKSPKSNGKKISFEELRHHVCHLLIEIQYQLR